ncbi:MAG TPA: QsdR family transcriptional regulator [Solirubrobacteraceae bacterium]|jgi:AcrR family transcriptional regulator|nr:QsdR family transcriptional regulator [Solirubrobacteraceae bacterium]
MQAARPPVAGGRPGRPAAASREDALALARARYMAGERIDVQAIARELGLARATMHRWFRTRELLLGEVLAELGEERLEILRRRVGGHGAKALLNSFDAFNRELAAAEGLRSLLVSEHELALRVLTSSTGVVQPRMAGAVQRMIEDELRAGFETPLAPDLLAYAIVRLAEAFLYNDAVAGATGDPERLRQIEAALLGLDPSR